MSATAKKLFESLREAKEAVLEAVPSLGRIVPEVGAEFDRQVAHGASEFMNALHTGNAFVLYGTGQDLPGVEHNSIRPPEEVKEVEQQTTHERQRGGMEM